MYGTNVHRCKYVHTYKINVRMTLVSCPKFDQLPFKLCFTLFGCAFSKMCMVIFKPPVICTYTVSTSVSPLLHIPILQHMY